MCAWDLYAKQVSKTADVVEMTAEIVLTRLCSTIGRLHFKVIEATQTILQSLDEQSQRARITVGRGLGQRCEQDVAVGDR